jgi:phospholipid-binding lipoprotein MlaA
MRFKPAVVSVALALLTAACAVPGPGNPPGEVFDPYEAQNRKVHDFNRKLDQRFLRGTGTGYAQSVPPELRAGISNFADTLSLPQTVVNQVLQGRLDRATRNSLRFTVNATLGLGGILDVASDLGLAEDSSDFGETLHVWGLPEGAYLELPLFGPSTERDAVGDVVDLFTNPLDYVLPPRPRQAKTAVRIVAKVGERGEFSDTVDSILYDSADSYAQLRLIYLQNRRFDLGDASDSTIDYIDPEALDTEGF